MGPAERSGWPAERRPVEAGYRTLAFPFEELPHPPFALEFKRTFEQLLGHVSSGCATARHQKQKGTDTVPLLLEALRSQRPPGAARLPMPLALRAARLATQIAS